jgi:cell wall-associated NlpC family hydrolase
MAAGALASAMGASGLATSASAATPRFSPAVTGASTATPATVTAPTAAPIFARLVAVRLPAGPVVIRKPAVRRPSPAALAAARIAAEEKRALSVALSEVGKPYVYGAAGPGAFDCSGLTRFAYAAAGVRLPRTSYAQIGATARVSGRDLRPGDLLFFYSGGHVGIYVGHGMMVDAPHSGARVRVESVAWFGPLAATGRPRA